MQEEPGFGHSCLLVPNCAIAVPKLSAMFSLVRAKDCGYYATFCTIVVDRYSGVIGLVCEENDGEMDAAPPDEGPGLGKESGQRRGGAARPTGS